jgi:hypothetical protein
MKIEIRAYLVLDDDLLQSVDESITTFLGELLIEVVL